jgi:hypothetical protein
LKGVYNGCMDWVHAPPLPLAASQISYEFASI